MFEKKYEVIFLQKEYSTMNLVRILKMNNLPDKITIGNKTFVIDIEKPAYSQKITKVYMVDFENGSQLKFDEIKSILNPKLLDTVISHQLVKELTAGAIADKKEKIINMLIGLVMGALLSALIVYVLMSQKIEELYQNMNVVVTGL